jgi:hypothetical protein
MREATSRCFYDWPFLITEEALLYYYTDIDALLNGIIVKDPKENKEICLWATRCTHLNDKNELMEGIEQMKKIVKPHVVEKLNEAVKVGHTISFSRQRDSLPMWSMYGRNGTGVMLSFDVEVLAKKYFNRLQPCVYVGTEYDNDVFDNIYKREWGDDFNKADDEMKSVVSILMASQYIMLRKNRTFEYEDECRIIGIGFPYFMKEKDREVLYRNKNGIIVPYIEEFFPKKALKEVMLGPNLDPELSKATLEEFLSSRGFNVDVKMSKVPYRG